MSELILDYMEMAPFWLFILGALGMLIGFLGMIFTRNNSDSEVLEIFVAHEKTRLEQLHMGDVEYPLDKAMINDLMDYSTDDLRTHRRWIMILKSHEELRRQRDDLEREREELRRQMVNLQFEFDAKELECGDLYTQVERREDEMLLLEHHLWALEDEQERALRALPNLMRLDDSKGLDEHIKDLIDDGVHT